MVTRHLFTHRQRYALLHRTMLHL